MNNFKMSVFALGMSLSMSGMAAGTMDSGTGSEDNLNRLNSSEPNKMRDCNIRNGNDKLLCEKEMQNDAERSLPNNNSRINRNNDGNMIDDRKSKDLQSKDLQFRDRELNNSQPLGSSFGDVPLNTDPSSSGSDGSGTGSLNAM